MFENRKMTQFKIILFLFLISTTLVGQQKVTLKILLTAPERTDAVFIAGNHRHLGHWNPSRVPLKQISDGTFSLTLQFPKNTTLEYKFTRGSWATEAMNADSTLPANHHVVLKTDTTLLVTIHQWKDNLSQTQGQITGTTVLYENFYSPQLKNKRNIIVWLPPSYQNTENQYPVLYLHDGQNVFDPKTSFLGYDWQLDETVTRLIKNKKITEIIMVGLYNTEKRTEEYSPVRLGKMYSDFLVHTVKPFIDSTYRTRPERNYTAVLGSSMGGIISFHIAWEYSDAVSMAGCFSPAFLIDKYEIIKRVKKYNGTKKPIKVILFNGSEGLDRRFQRGVTRMEKALKKKGFREPENFLVKVFEGAEHNEPAWSLQSEDALLYFFGR